MLSGVFHNAHNLGVLRVFSNPDAWVKTNLHDICRLLEHIGGDAHERGAWAARIFAAIEDGDVDAAAAVKARLGAARPLFGRLLVLSADDVIEARAYDLVTGACADDDARFWFASQRMAHASSMARASVSWFV